MFTGKIVTVILSSITEEKEKYQAASRVNQDRGGRGGGNRGNGRGSYTNDREFRGNFERGGKAGRGRGGDRRPDRNPRDLRDDPRPREDNRFKDRRDGPRGRDLQDSKPKKDGSTNGKSTSKPKDKGDNKAPRFQNPRYDCDQSKFECFQLEVVNFPGSTNHQNMCLADLTCSMRAPGIWGTLQPMLCPQIPLWARVCQIGVDLSLEKWK